MFSSPLPNHDEGIEDDFGFSKKVNTESLQKDNVDAEIVNVAKIREALSGKNLTLTATTTWLQSEFDRAISSAERQKAPDLLEKWRSTEWLISNEPIYQLSRPITSGLHTARRENSVAEIIANLGTDTTFHMGSRIASRLEYLVEASKEEFPDQEPMSPASLEGFLIFVRSVQNIIYPDIVLTYEGHIRAEWTRAQSNHFAVEFFDANKVRYVVFTPDRWVPHRTNRCSGLSTLYSLMDLVQPFGVFEWIRT